MRRLLIPACLLLAALTLGACNANFTSFAATVDSATISQHELNETVQAADASSGFRCVVTGGGAEATRGAGVSYNAGFAAQMLTTLVEGRALKVELARHQLRLTGFARSVGRSELEQALAPGQATDQSCTEPAAAVLASLPASVRARLIDLQAAQAMLAARAIGAQLSVAGVAAWAKAHPSAARVTCLSVAPFPSKAAAAAFVAQLRKGASFSSAAASSGTQAQAGCVQATALPGGLGAVVDALAPQQISSPTPYGSTWLVFTVSSRRSATGSEAAGFLLNTAASKVGALVNRALARVEVQIDPAYGSWRNVQGTYQVVPRSGPPAAALFNSVAVTTPASSALSVG